MTKSEFNRVWIYLKGLFPEMVETTDLNFEAYFDTMKDLEYGVVIDAARRYARESGAKFFPSAPEFRRWADPPKTDSELTFERAVKEHRIREKTKKEILGEFLKEKLLEGEVLVRVHYNEDDPFRDDWKFLPSKSAEEFDSAHIVEVPQLREYLEGAASLAPSIRNAVLNLARDWAVRREVKGELPS